ncbi:glutaredoxin [Sphingomonas sp. LB-2]|uniref:MauE/DoxX family redox-associated membrane protein n=1 Tax=Sphingomonas caeni TaxID=2984949 RepID=UPI002231F548|nr:MauE/DoxX family redox-associated membrane protein [Sphingomonas caeni]MCW3847429.1 glutaredoxin [Sphingomonas caeni]
MSAKPHAILYRLATSQHLCPWGLRSLHLLRSRGYQVEDQLLTTPAANDAFKADHGVKTTPQAFIDGRRIGGYEDLRRYFGLKVRDPKALTYAPVIAVFGMAAAIAVALSEAVLGTPFTLSALQWFIAIAMCLLALLKLRDLDGFATGFLGYDLLARRWVPYAKLYPFAEGIAGVLMLASPAFHWIASPIALFIGSIGAISVFKAVYIDKRELKCACVGGDSNVPLGFISLTENLLMVGMALWMTGEAF